MPPRGGYRRRRRSSRPSTTPLRRGLPDAEAFPDHMRHSSPHPTTETATSKVRSCTKLPPRGSRPAEVAFSCDSSREVAIPCGNRGQNRTRLPPRARRRTGMPPRGGYRRRRRSSWPSTTPLRRGLPDAEAFPDHMQHSSPHPTTETATSKVRPGTKLPPRGPVPPRWHSRAIPPAKWQFRAEIGAKTAQDCHLGRGAARECHLEGVTDAAVGRRRPATSPTPPPDAARRSRLAAGSHQETPARSRGRASGCRADRAQP